MAFNVPLCGARSEGLTCIVDDSDAELVMLRRWYAHHEGYDRSHVYAVSDRPSVRMHRLILGVSRGCIVDHVNGDGLDNRKCNLRIATIGDNARNRRKVGGRVPFKGVVVDGNAFVARIAHNGRSLHCGRFSSARDAAIAYDSAAIRLHGEFACTNSDMGLL
jgi:hypothetical protein